MRSQIRTPSGPRTCGGGSATSRPSRSIRQLQSGEQDTRLNWREKALISARAGAVTLSPPAARVPSNTMRSTRASRHRAQIAAGRDASAVVAGRGSGKPCAGLWVCGGWLSGARGALRTAIDPWTPGSAPLADKRRSSATPSVHCLSCVERDWIVLCLASCRNLQYDQKSCKLIYQKIVQKNVVSASFTE